MIDVQSHNNHGLFRVQSQQKKKTDRFAIQRSKTNSPLTMNYHPQTAKLRHRKIRRRLLNGRGDENSPSPSVLTTPKQIDFTELEQIFDNALRDRLSIDFYKRKPSVPIETRIDLVEDLPQPRVHSKKSPLKLILFVAFIVLSALIGFFSVFIFLK